jgi:putative transposase
MILVEEHAPTVGVVDACRTIGVSRATWYRRRARREVETPGRRSRNHPRRLGDTERARVLEVLCSEEFIDRAPREIYAILLERGTYLCSVRTMYRILAERKAVRERRAQRNHPENPVPRCRATGPNQLWSWDITKLPGPLRTYFSLYVVLDVFARYIVAWLLAQRESAYLATRLIEQAINDADIDPGQLTVHADRGAPMTAKPLVQTLADLGVERSHSRPRVSNDNPFSEAQFKTMKYCPAWPDRFTGRQHAHDWCTSFVRWYNHEHRHEGIGLFAPADVYFGRHLEIGRVRRATLDAAFAAHPERFVRGRPTPPSVPQEVWINRPTQDNVVLRHPVSSEAPALLGGRGGPGGEGPRLPLVAAIS